MLDTEYWNTLIQTEGSRLAKDGVVVLRAWKMDWVGFGIFMSIWESFEPQNLPKCLTSDQPLLSVLEAS